MTDCLTYTSIAPTGPELEADWQAARNNPLGITTRLWASVLSKACPGKRGYPARTKALWSHGKPPKGGDPTSIWCPS